MDARCPTSKSRSAYVGLRLKNVLVAGNGKQRVTYASEGSPIRLMLRQIMVPDTLPSAGICSLVIGREEQILDAVVPLESYNYLYDRGYGPPLPVEALEPLRITFLVSGDVTAPESIAWAAHTMEDA